MFLPGLGYPMRPPDWTDEQWEAALAKFHKGERIGGIVALSLLGVGLACALIVFIVLAGRFL